MKSGNTTNYQESVSSSFYGFSWLTSTSVLYNCIYMNFSLNKIESDLFQMRIYGQPRAIERWPCLFFYDSVFSHNYGNYDFCNFDTKVSHV